MSAEPFTVNVVLKTSSGVAEDPIEFSSGVNELETHVVEVAAGAAVGRHHHPGPCLMYVLEGQLEIALDDGQRRTYSAGEAFVEDAHTWIDNRNPGDQPARFLAVVSGAPGTDKVLFD